MESKRRKICNKAIIAFFLITFSAFLSLGSECLLVLAGSAFSVFVDVGSVVNKYPRFDIFCFVVGFVSLIALIVLVIFNITISEKLDYKKHTWYFQYIFSVALSIPMIKLWEMLFDFLEKTF